MLIYDLLLSLMVSLLEFFSMSSVCCTFPCFFLLSVNVFEIVAIIPPSTQSRNGFKPQVLLEFVLEMKCF